MIPGKKITLGGKVFEIPPAPFAAMRRHADLFNGKTTADTDMMGDLIYSAVKRNYPDLSQEEFEEKHLDLGNMTAAFNIVMNLSGAEATKGEAQPGNP